MPEKGLEAVFEAVRRHDFSRNNGYDGVADLSDPAWKIRTLALRDLARADSAGLPALMAYLEDGDEVVRELAAQALGFWMHREAGASLVRALAYDPSPKVRVAAAEAIGLLGDPDLAVRLEEGGRVDAEKDVRDRCALALRRLRAPERPQGLRETYAELDASRFNIAVLGQAPPPVALEAVDGIPWRLQAHLGRGPIVLVWVFAEWCPVCHHEMDELRSLEQAYGEAGVAVATVECHDRFRCEAMLGGQGSWWPHLIDPAGAVGLAYGVDPQEFVVHQDWINRPCAFIIDRRGLLSFAYKGTFFGDRPTMAELLRMAVQEDYHFEHPQRRKI